jgi:hypothetical protein
MSSTARWRAAKGGPKHPGRGRRTTAAWVPARSRPEAMAKDLRTRLLASGAGNPAMVSDWLSSWPKPLHGSDCDGIRDSSAVRVTGIPDRISGVLNITTSTPALASTPPRMFTTATPPTWPGVRVSGTKSLWTEALSHCRLAYGNDRSQDIPRGLCREPSRCAEQRCSTLQEPWRSAHSQTSPESPAGSPHDGRAPPRLRSQFSSCPALRRTGPHAHRWINAKPW